MRFLLLLHGSCGTRAMQQGCIRTVGGAGGYPLLDPPPPPPLPMFEADSQNFASVPSVPRGFKLEKFLGWITGGPWEEGGPSQPPPPPPIHHITAL